MSQRRYAAVPAMTLLALALTGCETAQAVTCDPAQIGFVESRLGIDYRALAPSPVADILSQAEVEYLGNTDASLGDATVFWSALTSGLLAGTLAGSFTGAGSEPSLDNLRIQSPNALALLQACGPAADARLDYLREIEIRLLPVEGGSE
jgi:hypothetical protein